MFFTAIGLNDIKYLYKIFCVYTFFCGLYLNTYIFMPELLWNMTEENLFNAGWNRTMAHLEENFALCHEPGLGRLRFHPLVILYFMKAMASQSLVLRGDWFDQSCNK